jgi:hypothetical protein
MANGKIAAPMPSTKQMLQIFEPTTLPIAMPPWPLQLALILTTNSGALVPKATTVKPITSGLIPSLMANSDDPFTNHSAP